MSISFRPSLLVSITTATVIGISGTAAASSQSFDELDLDKNHKLSRAELVLGAEILLKRWDTGGDGNISVQELGSALHSLWEHDDISDISEDEYTIGRILWLPRAKALSFASLDSDNNARLSREELIAALPAMKAYRQFDRDRRDGISQHELQRAMMNLFDENRDGLVAINEWPLIGAHPQVQPAETMGLNDPHLQVTQAQRTDGKASP